MKIYTNVEVVPSRLTALVKLLAAQGPLPPERLCALLQPREDRGMAQKVMDAAAELGVIHETPTGYGLTSPFAKLPLDEDDNRSLRRALAPVLLAPEVGGARNGFAVLCAWLLTIELEHVPENHAGLKSALEADGWSLDDLQVRADLRWDNVLYWARFLGLLCRLGDLVTSLLVPDPTEYLRMNADRLLKAGEKIRIGEFQRRLGALCPVLDGGKVRATVLKLSPRSLAADTLSPALSLALMRLADRGDLALSSPDDEKTVMHLSGGRGRVAFITRPA